MTMHIKVNLKSPFQIVRIYWEVDNVSGNTEIYAWAAQGEIEKLEHAGYSINNVEVI